MDTERDKEEGAAEIRDRNGYLMTPTYRHCTATTPFCPSASLAPEQVNESLNLDLGQTIFNPRNKAILWIIKFLNSVGIEWWETYLFRVWNLVPVSWRRWVFYSAWKIYFPLHRRLLGRRTGIHPDASPEYHALTTVMWWGRFFPVSIRRMRFSLEQLTAWTRNVQLSRVEKVAERMSSVEVPSDQQGNDVVKGLYVHVAEEPTECCILWIYGGAFLSGDVDGNVGPAERMGRETGMDVFLVFHRLVPEAVMNDMLWDTSLGYRWLCERRVSQGKSPTNTFVLGISSGAALATRLLQSIVETQRGEATLPAYLTNAVSGQPMPAGGMLFGPFVDFTKPRGCLLAFGEHDLIVNQRVLEEGLPYLATHMGGSRRDHSPVFRSFEGLPPLCVVISEHEAVFEHAVDLVNKARAAGVPVTVGCWKYMCHVFTFLNGFVPEGEQSFLFAERWFRAQQQIIRDESSK